MGPSLTLLQTAFGHTATPYSVLQCPTSSTPEELKRAYRVAALRYHPDRQIRHGVKQNNHADEGGSSLKFQAVSAAYQVLMDDLRRAYYDKTGIIREDEDNSSSTRPTSSTRHSRRGSTSDWETFFESVFNDIRSTGRNHDEAAKTYRNSNEETNDVLRYYTACHGDINLVVECVPYGSNADIDRWNKDIIIPAISRGMIPNFNVETVTKQQNRKKVEAARRLRVDSNDQDVYNAAKNNVVIKRQKRRIILEDSSSDDEDVDDKGNAITTIDVDESKAKQVKSKRDKLDIRVAKKRKATAVKEMEIANILHSKDWKKDGMSATAAAAATQKRRKYEEYGISDALLSNLATKYCGNDKKKKRK